MRLNLHTFPPVELQQPTSPPQLIPKQDWWPCFVCGVEVICAHRETDIIVWMERHER